MAVARTGVACMPAAMSTFPVEIASTSSLQPPTSTMLRSTFISLATSFTISTRAPPHSLVALSLTK